MRMRPGTCASLKSYRVILIHRPGYGSALSHCPVATEVLAEALGQAVVRAAYISILVEEKTHLALAIRKQDDLGLGLMRPVHCLLQGAQR